MVERAAAGRRELEFVTRFRFHGSGGHRRKADLAITNMAVLAFPGKPWQTSSPLVAFKEL
jgi:hypothetical protein